jgi:type IV pilus assembly protein PilV
MNHDKPFIRGPRGLRGAGLIEALIALLILAFGVLGVAGLQMASLRDSQSSVERSQATLMSYSILDAMRANRAAAVSGAYNTNGAGNALAAADLGAWLAALQGNINGSASGQVNCDNAGVCTITVQWQNERSIGGGTTQTVQVTTQL